MIELSPPSIRWKDGAPYSEQFDDIYYMNAQGLDETNHVFVQGNDIANRLIKKDHFTIAETGFGTGLNFLAVWQLWQSLGDKKPILHYISTDAFPLTIDDLKKAYALFPELTTFSEELHNVYPPSITGTHRRYLAGGKIILDLLWGDSVEMLSHYHIINPTQKVDAWFLDGFAPSKNPDMWCEDLYRAMAQLSHADTTLATFTAAGHVRRGLQDAGFDVKKVPGFAHKRDMITGQYEVKNSAAPHIASNKDTIIIGAGIAGISTAWHLAKQARHVTIIEASDTICAGASGNPASAFTPFYSDNWNARSRLLASGFWNTHHIIDYLTSQGHNIIGKRHGTLMLDLDDTSKRAQRLAERQRSLNLPDTIRQNVNTKEASEIANVELSYGGWFYPHGGWCCMRSLCDAMLHDASDKIDIEYDTEINRIEHHDGQWRAYTINNTPFFANTMVVANAHAAMQLLPELKLSTIHGQLIHFHAPESLQHLKCTLHAGHTLIPIRSETLSWGATFRHHLPEPRIIEEDTYLLLHDLQIAFPDINIEEIQKSVTPWAGLRCSHTSRHPLIGQALNHPDGLYLNLAHGSRGLLSGLLPLDIFKTSGSQK